MKRWQDRGEVLDSDEESELDLDLEAEEGSVRKRARIESPRGDGDERRNLNGESAVSVGWTEPGNENDEDWLKPKVANTYGKRSKLTRPGSRQSANASPSKSTTPSAFAEIAHQTLRTSECHDVEGPAADEDLDPPTSGTPDQHGEQFASSILSTPGRVIESAPAQNGQSDFVTRSSSQKDLPDVHEFLNRANIPQGVERPPSNGNLSSGLSSPLSERSISPPAPAILRFPRPGQIKSASASPSMTLGKDGSPPGNLNTGSVERQDNSDGLPQLSATPSEIVDTTQNGRRTFRARKAQQLHPYEYEMMQYQKQLRERGLRPVKVVQAERRVQEAQHAASSDTEQDSWQPSQRARSSPPKASSEIGESNDAVNEGGSDDNLPDILPSTRPTAFALVQNGSKRQKLLHPRHRSRRTSTTGAQPTDDFSIPPSPPPTSSESNDNRDAITKPPTFKFPRGMTPSSRTQQPTPNVSSDVRRAYADSDEDLPARSRLSTASRNPHAPVPIDNSTDSSELESQPDDDPEVRRLLKERKRIRGVLPASWLKIDFKAQQIHTSSPEKRREQAIASPEKTLPPKGVAQRIAPRPSATQRAPIPISDDESDNDLSTYLSAAKKRQSRLQFNQPQASAPPDDFEDEDRMEVDYVDAMLGGTSRSKTTNATSKKRQPRIVDAFNAGRRKSNDFAEKHRAARQSGGGKSHVKGFKRHARQRTAPKPSATRLSILDAPRQAIPTPEQTPQFVKLAMRRARAQPDHGRHSPSRKFIRLATERDTGDATSVLRAWREGTIAPRQHVPHHTHDQQIQVPKEKSISDSTSKRRQRLPLSELSRNQQSHLPAGIRTSAAKQQKGARRLDLSKKATRQSKLEPVSLEDGVASQPEETEVRGEKNEDQAQHHGHRRLKPPAPQPRFRGAQLESLESEFDRGHRAAAFERRMHVLTENVVRQGSRRTPAAPIQLERFLHDPDVVRPLQRTRERSPPQPDSIQDEQPIQTRNENRTLAHRPRKRLPQRVDAEARQYRQPSEPLPEVIDISTADTYDATAGPVLYGLGPFGTRYSIDFDTLPLPLGTYFRESSFIGSGDFAASLNFAGRNLDVATGRIRIHVDAEVLDLGIWNEEVAAGLARIPRAVSHALQSLGKDEDMQGSQDSPEVVLANVDYLLRSSVRYFSRCLAFSDPVDRRACIPSLHRLVEDILEAAADSVLTAEPNKGLKSRCLQYAAVLARQALNLCDHATIPTDVSHASQQLFERATARLAGHFVDAHIGDLRHLYEELRRAVKREAGIRDTDSGICAINVLHHVTKGLKWPGSNFWTTLNSAMNVHLDVFSSVSAFDRIWCNLFTVLPALEIDAYGILQLGSRLNSAGEDWSICKALTERLFQLYPATCNLPGSTVNEYMRTTFNRCFRLHNRWGWHQSEPILYSISDFFARRGLAQLHKEESHGSPAFLEELDQQPSLEVYADDRSFQVFLKMLASGLRMMRERGVYPDKKIGGIVWRFIPNHGRTHRKDADVRKEDLDALRNHHDLLSTLYYASPPNHRIRVDLIQNLVDHTASHREACRLNVRAWRNLAAFQSSTKEPTERLVSFSNWFQELLTANISQFRLARTEVEQDVASAVASGKPPVSQDVIENVIVANQRQIAATITDALAAVKHAVKTSSSSAAMLAVIEGTQFWQAFELFDPNARKIFGVFDEGLKVFKAALEARKKFEPDEGSQIGSDDSQDYGDSSALQELASTQMKAGNHKADLQHIMNAPLAGFLSTVFGAERMSDDGLLAKVVDVWVELATVIVSKGTKTWASYISGYGSEAWSQLRDTEQRRKYTPYFLARVAEASDANLAETGILSFWLRSLVDREATLKFQHTLTNSLLNRQDSEPLLVNLPFVRPRSGQFAMSLHQLRQTRLGLVSSVLSNMHQYLDDILRTRPAKYSELRRTYADMLRQMMQAMKANYQEVQVSDGDAADPQAQGEYVGFVQQVVSFLQQYTADICPIDRFFTDSSAFPLPAADPTYVVGRLKGYVPKLSDSGKRKELAVFVQTVSERAAVDGQQEYLVDQLTAAMAGVLERGRPQTPSLRHVLLTAIFPAYIENALSTACSWILAVPVLQACGRTMEDILYSVKLDDKDSIRVALDTIAEPTHCMIRIVETALAYPGQLTFTNVLATMRLIFDAARQSLTAAHHIARIAKDHHLALAASHLSQCGSAIEDLLSGDEFADLPSVLSDHPTEPCQWQDTKAFSERQFKEKLNGWNAREGRYFMRRGPASVEVMMHLEGADEEKQRLVEALRRYQETYESVFGRQGRDSTVSTTDELVV